MSTLPEPSPNFFDSGSPYLSHPLLTPERTRAEVDTLLSTLDMAEVPRRVLDVGCGFGRHTVEFARRGSAVVAIDPSATMCDETRRRLAEQNLEARVLHGVPADFGGDSFSDLALSLFTSFGQIGADEATYEQQLAQFFRMLRPGGAAVFELPEKHRCVGGLVESEQLGPTTVSRRFDAATSIVHERFETPSGDFSLAYRVFERAEFIDLLSGAGFDITHQLDTGLATPPPTLMTVFVRRPDVT